MGNMLTFCVETNIILIIFAKLKGKTQISGIYNSRNEVIL
jgi:hypothetical protein